MGILDGDGASILNGVFGAIYPTGSLIRRNITEDTGGTQTVTYPDGEDGIPIKVQTDRVTEAMRTAPGYTDTDVALIILTAGLGDSVTTDDHVIDSRGDTWAVTMPALDACGSHWTARGQRA